MKKYSSLKIVQSIWLALIIIAAPFPAWAIEVFNPDEANKGLDTLSIKLHTDPMSTEELIKTQKSLIEKKKLAEACIAEETKELEDINEQLPSADKEPEESITLTADQRYLEKKKVDTKTRLAGCKLFVIRSTELIALFSAEAKTKQKNIILSTTQPLWETLPNLSESYSTWLTELKSIKISKILGFETYHQYDLFIICMLLASTLLISSYTKNKIKLYTKSNHVKSELEQDFSAFLIIIRKHLGIILFLGTLIIYESIHDYLIQKDFALDTFLMPFLIFYLMVGVIDFLTHPPISKSLFNVKGKHFKESFCYSLKFFLFMVLCIYFGSNIQDLIPQNPLLFDAVVIIFYTILALNLFVIVKSFTHLTLYFDNNPISKSLINFANTILLIFNITCQWSGHIELSIYLLKGITYSISLTFISLAIYTYLMSILEKLFSKQHPWKLQAFKFIHKHRSELILELVTLKIVMFLFVWGWLFIKLNDVWTISELWSVQLRQIIYEGFDVADARIIPIRIIFALLFFAVTTLFVKILKHQLLPEDKSSIKAEQEAYLVIIGYISIGISLIFSLMIAGVDFKGLALVAGALSVGIGFGLQHIVNNFVSGIVLLLERPVKKGDRIVVGNKEGFVTNIGVRSTTVKTLEQSHIIVPNSDLVTKEVKNYMVNNKKSRLKVEARMKFNAPAEKVEAILYEAAHAHPEVSKDKGDEPAVFCIGYFEDALQFNLWCTVLNVNLKYRTRSDIYFLIDRRFREEGIQYYFVQADINIKDSSHKPPATDE